MYLPFWENLSSTCPFFQKTNNVSQSVAIFWVTRYNQIQSVKLQRGCVSYSWPRGPGLRTYGPTVVPPHRWRWLKHWSSCNRCNEHKKCGDDPRQELEDFCPTEMDTSTWKVACGMETKWFFWIRGEGGSSLEVHLYVYTNGCWTIKFRPPVATNIPVSSRCVVLFKDNTVFFWLGICIIYYNMIICVLPI